MNIVMTDVASYDLMLSFDVVHTCQDCHFHLRVRFRLESGVAQALSEVSNLGAHAHHATAL